MFTRKRFYQIEDIANMLIENTIYYFRQEIFLIYADCNYIKSYSFTSKKKCCKGNTVLIVF